MFYFYASSLRPISIASHVWLFRGAEGGLWLEKLRDEQAQNTSNSLIHDPALRKAKKQKLR